MGIQLYLLGSRKTSFFIEDHSFQIGTLKRFYKSSEITPYRESQMAAVAAQVKAKPAPKAVMMESADESPYHLRLKSAPTRPANAHLLLGWERDRSSISDYKWDYLPVLGYLVESPTTGWLELYDENDGYLQLTSYKSAIKNGILNKAGQMDYFSQPGISKCLSLTGIGADHVTADCLLDNGELESLIVKVRNDNRPPLDWFSGKKPSQVVHYNMEDQPRAALQTMR
jgi:hypothetical protein